MRTVAASLALLVLVLFGIVGWQGYKLSQRSAAPISNAKSASTGQPPGSVGSGYAPTKIFAHNLMLRKGPSFRIYVRWLRGEMARSHRNVNPSFDDPESFYLNIQNGVIRVNMGDIGNYLNATGMGNSPLKNVTFSGNGDQIKLTGTMHKLISFPVELDGTLKALPDSRIQISVSKINVLKIPFKALLGGLHVTLAELFHTQGMPGIQVVGNNIFLDTQQLVPPPHIRGHLTLIHVVNPDLEEVYGDTETDVAKVEQWRNFLRLSGGTIDFGRLTMSPVDLMMIDISKDAWFDLDLTNYQTQLVNGYTRMTPQAGLQIFMPDLRDIPVDKTKPDTSIQWFKNRNAAPPPDIVKQTR